MEEAKRGVRHGERGQGGVVGLRGGEALASPRAGAGGGTKGVT